MDCKRIRERLGGYLDGEIEEALRRAIESHLEGCAQCRAEAVRLRSLRALLEGVATPPVPSGFAANVMRIARRRAVAGKEPDRPSVFRLGWLRQVPVATRATVVVALVAGVLAGSVAGWDVWRTHEVSSAAVPHDASDPTLVYSLDHLTESPPGSLASAYVSLVEAERQGE